MLYLCKENGKSVCLEYIDMKKKIKFHQNHANNIQYLERNLGSHILYFC